MNALGNNVVPTIKGADSVIYGISLLQDYDQVLGLNKNATQSDIKKSYKNLAKKSHPDVGDPGLCAVVPAGKSKYPVDELV